MKKRQSWRPVSRFGVLGLVHRPPRRLGLEPRPLSLGYRLGGRPALSALMLPPALLPLRLLRTEFRLLPPWVFLLARPARAKHDGWWYGYRLDVCQESGVGVQRISNWVLILTRKPHSSAKAYHRGSRQHIPPNRTSSRSRWNTK